ncbi:hypothetical protein Ciccas_010149 [Cichlidogyrus casuarinus]|uniref:Uncharacterized protein n=1 Tax=Cichlidogyrus casuarinus TaxID=1844966 RepID=A0ABD2PV92_9PLAT
MAIFLYEEVYPSDLTETEHLLDKMLKEDEFSKSNGLEKDASASLLDGDAAETESIHKKTSPKLDLALIFLCFALYFIIFADFIAFEG